MIFGQNCCINLEKYENFIIHALIFVDYYSAIYSIRGICVVFKWPKRPIFSFITIQYIEIKYFFAKTFGRCADILTFNSECECTVSRCCAKKSEKRKKIRTKIQFRFYLSETKRRIGSELAGPQLKANTYRLQLDRRIQKFCHFGAQLKRYVCCLLSRLSPFI